MDMATDEDLSFYGPHEDVDPASEDLVPPAFEKEIESFIPIVGEDIDAHGKIFSSDKFEAACKCLFRTNRFYVNKNQLEQVARKLMDLWAKYNISRSKQLFTVSKNKVTIHCCLITWTIKVCPVKGRGKGAAHRIMAGLDLDLPGLRVVKIIESLGHKHSNPIHRKPAPAAIKKEESLPFCSSEGELGRVRENPISVTPHSNLHTGGGQNSVQKKRADSAAAESLVARLAKSPSTSTPLRGGPKQCLLSEAKTWAGRKTDSPRDFYIISSGGESFPVHKNMLTAASPTLKTMLELAPPGTTELNTNFPALVVKAAVAAIYGKEPLEDEAVTNHLESCLSLASEYQLVGFQRLLHQHMLQKLTVDNIKRALLEAQKTRGEYLKAGCLKFVRENGRAVLKDTNIARFAMDRGLWSDIVDATLERSSPAVTNKRRQSDDKTHAPLELSEGNRGTINWNGAKRQQMNRSKDDQNSCRESLSIASTRDMLSNSPGPVDDLFGVNCHN